MLVRLLIMAALVALVALPAAFARGRTSTGATVPATDAEVVEVLPEGFAGPRLREMKDLRRALRAEPERLDLAVRFARLNMQQARVRSDPRFLGYAQAALAPWWKLESPPEEALFLRAALRQSTHDFDGALGDLDRLIALNSSLSDAWLTRAVVLSVLGQYADAEQSCARIPSAELALAAATCTANVESLSGRAERAYERLSKALAAPGRAGREEAVWALSTLGEIAQRLGRVDLAERHLREALAIDASDAYVLGAYGDLLLDLGRAEEVARLLSEKTSSDALLLRLAIAEARIAAPSADAHRQLLRERFSASRQRGDALHRREEARFELELEKNGSEALKLALKNWQVQREPWDARILLEAALATADARAATPVVAQLRANGYQEPKVAELARRIEEQTR